MSRKKLSRVVVFDLAKARLAAVKSIDPLLDLGNGISAASYEIAIDSYGLLVSQYNTALSSVDELYNKSIASLLTLKDVSERILAGVGSRFGKNSNEYEMAGGVRKTERKKSVKSLVKTK